MRALASSHFEVLAVSGRRLSASRLASFASILAAVLLLVGDGIAQSAAPAGIDPLEILNLAIKPNVLVVLDSSGSMRESPLQNDAANGAAAPFPSVTGDWQGSKMYQAKQVLRQVIADNDTKVSFLFGQYTQQDTLMMGTGIGPSLSSENRFFYAAAQSATGVTRSSTSDTSGLGLQAWQDLKSGWNTLYFTEYSATTTATPSLTIDANRNKFYYTVRTAGSSDAADYTFLHCTVTLPPSVYGTYTTDANRTTLATAINARTGTGTSADRTCRTVYASLPEKVYQVYSQVDTSPSLALTLTWSSTNKRFAIQGNSTIGYQLLGPQEAGSISGLLGFTTSLPAGLPNGGGDGGANAHWIAVTTAQNGAPLNLVPSGAATTVNCARTVTPAFYTALGPSTTAGTLANAIQTAMNGCTGTQGYTVTANNATGQITFTRNGARNFRIDWSGGPNGIAGALGMGGSPNTPLGAGPFSTGKALGLARVTPAVDGYSATSIGSVTVLRAGRFFNGQVLKVDSTGTVCGFLTAQAPSNPPRVHVEYVSTCASGSGTRVSFDWAGTQFSGNSIGCNGFRARTTLTRCDASLTQTAALNPLLDKELPLSDDGLTVRNYAEASDGSYATTQVPPLSSIVADGSTPIGSSISSIRTNVFGGAAGLYNAGQASPAIPAINTHSLPRERTILLFVTDGDDTCSGQSDGNENALAAAYQAELLYRPLATTAGGTPTGTGVQASGSLAANADPASSVSTYMVGFGSGAAVNRLNWIAWGGSGLGNTAGVANNGTKWTSSSATLDTLRASCTACSDAYVAPDAQTLASVLQQIIEQGATTGSFTAQQSITASIFELAGVVPGYDPLNPIKRYDALVPILFQASFTMPGFKGAVSAYQNVAGSASLKWDAGARMLASVQAGMNAIPTPANLAPAAAGQGTFLSLYGGNASVTDAGIAGIPYGIKRRIYTTTRNGVLYDGTIDSLLNGASPQRVTLWPPAASVAPVSDTAEGALDVALGLPSDGTIGSGATATAQFDALKATFRACKGTPVTGAAASCTGSTNATLKAQRARREAREMILANLAGATFRPDAAGDPVRVTGTGATGQILYQARPTVLAESTLSPPAVIQPPIRKEPTLYVPEYRSYRDGPRLPSGQAQDGLAKGFGLRNPDADGTTTSGNDSRTSLKPAMTVLLVGANDMLHAFRAAACVTGTCTDAGGEELWGFVPFDRLGVLKNLLQGQTRDNKTYVIASGIRFADVFVPANGGSFSASAGTATVTGSGVWRTLVLFGRGRGGKYLTAIDVTNRGPFTQAALQSQAPIVLWNRGNPDTQNGLSGGTPNNGLAAAPLSGGLTDLAAYAKMGETWSVPAVASVDPNANQTARKPAGVPFVAYVGSGYAAAADPSNPAQGTTFFTLDALTGDVIAAADVQAEAQLAGVKRDVVAAPGVPAWPNALVAAPAVYSASQLMPGQPGHPAERATRVYIGDLHGHLWKFLTAHPQKALLVADVGPGQPIGTAVSLLALPASGDPALARPHLYFTSGNDTRANPPFSLHGVKDQGDDSSATYSAAATTAGVTVYDPALYLFSRQLEPLFRGTLQPATAFSAANQGRVFFGATRFNQPGSAYAPPPFPCRSSFDSIVYALGAETGSAAYDLNSSGDDAFLIFSGSRKTALQVIKEPRPVGSTSSASAGRLNVDEGLITNAGVLQPPPPPGEQPKSGSDWPSVGYPPVDGTKMPFLQLSAPRLCQ